LFNVEVLPPVLGMPALLVLELDELLELEELVVGVAEGVAELLEELPVLGVVVAAGVAVAELLELLEELLVPDVAVAAGVAVAELPVLDVAVGLVALLEELPVLELEEPPVTGTAPPATVLVKLPVALTPIFSSFMRRPRS